MGHHICAIIGKRPINENIVKQYLLAVAYENGYAIILLDQDSVFYWSEKLSLGFDSISENIRWACGVAFYFAYKLGLEEYAIIQTDYFGGTGEQYAQFFKNGESIGEEKSINEVLRNLGVKATPGMDEFDTVNLGEYRDTAYYYWDEGNFADKMPNMIAGRIPKKKNGANNGPADQPVLVKELIGKTITDIFSKLHYEPGGMDSGEIFIELDGTLLVEIPYNLQNADDRVHVTELPPDAKTIFEDLEKLFPVYHVNPERKSIQEIIDKYAEKKLTFFEKIKQFFTGKKEIAPKKITEYEPYKVEYVENELKHIKNRIIKDIIRFDAVDEKCFLELDNGYLISETKFSNNGTGLVGINLYENLQDITKWKGEDFERIGDQKDREAE